MMFATMALEALWVFNEWLRACCTTEYRTAVSAGDPVHPAATIMEQYRHAASRVRAHHGGCELFRDEATLAAAPMREEIHERPSWIGWGTKVHAVDITRPINGTGSGGEEEARNVSCLCDVGRDITRIVSRCGIFLFEVVVFGVIYDDRAE